MNMLKVFLAVVMVMSLSVPCASATGEPEEPKGPGFVIYGDDGHPIG